MEQKYCQGKKINKNEQNMAKGRISQHVEKIQQIQIKTRSSEMETGNESNQVFVKRKVARTKGNFQNHERNG